MAYRNQQTHRRFSIQTKDFKTILEITECGMATSRETIAIIIIKDGKKYAHTIDPERDIRYNTISLSSTVIAKDCMTADALATAFMVMGLEEAEKFLQSGPQD